MKKYYKLYKIDDKWYLFNGEPKEQYLDWADNKSDIDVLNKLQDYDLICVDHYISYDFYYLIKK